jgi:predicted dehydrogenase
MSNKIKLGMIGVGHMGQYHVNVATGLTEQCEVVGVYDADTNRAAEIAAKFNAPNEPDMDALIKRSDAVVIAVPTVYHYEIAKKAIEQGKHVLLEKPMTETVEQAKEIVELAEKKGLILQVGHVERFNGAVLELSKVVDKPYLVESRRLAPFNPRISDVGVVLDLLIHDLDIIINLIGGEIKHVNASGKQVFSKHEDVAAAVLQFDNGAVASLSASRATQSKIRTLTISQENAYIVLDFSTQDIDIHRQASSASIVTSQDEMKYKQESLVEKIFVHKDNPLKQEHQHFLACITGEQKPLVQNISDIRTLEVAHKILKQIQES